MRDPRVVEQLTARLRELAIRHAVEMCAATELVLGEYPHGVGPVHERIARMWQVEIPQEPFKCES